MLKRPDFVTYDAEGQLDRIYCKICGAEIAGNVTRPKGSGPQNNIMVQRFIRFPNYAEIKMLFDDGVSTHVTNGCKDCLSARMDKSLLLELYLADCAEQGMPPGEAKPEMVVVLDHTAQGIV